jgi:hypothetical protein
MNWFKKTPSCVICYDKCEHSGMHVVAVGLEQKKVSICDSCYHTIIDLSPKYMDMVNANQALTDRSSEKDRYIEKLSSQNQGLIDRLIIKDQIIADLEGKVKSVMYSVGDANKEILDIQEAMRDAAISDLESLKIKYNNALSEISELRHREYVSAKETLKKKIRAKKKKK